MLDNGIRLAALYSVGCPELVQMNLDSALWSFVVGEPTASISAESARGILEKLDPFVFYQLIAFAVNEKDCFSESVVRAHWLGNGALNPVQDSDVKQVLTDLSSRDSLDVHKLAALALKLRGLIGFVPHHNFCVLQLFAGLKKRGKIPERIITEADRCLVKPGKVVSKSGGLFGVKNLVLVPGSDGGLDVNVRVAMVDSRLISDAAPVFVSTHLGRVREAISEEDSQKLENLLLEAVDFSNK